VACVTTRRARQTSAYAWSRETSLPYSRFRLRWSSCVAAEFGEKSGVTDSSARLVTHGEGGEDGLERHRRPDGARS